MRDEIVYPIVGLIIVSVLIVCGVQLLNHNLDTPPEPNAVEFNNVVIHPRGTPCIYDSSRVFYCEQGDRVLIMRRGHVIVIPDSIDIVKCNPFKEE